MQKTKILSRILELFNTGENIIQYLKLLNKSKFVTSEDILISYDFQAGTYSKRADINRKIRDGYCQNLAKNINDLGVFDSILEVGVGEASTLGNLLLKLKVTPSNIFGFDLSWSRIKYANIFIEPLFPKDKYNIKLTTGDLFNAPFKDNSLDIVYTSHTLEPNGGLEKEALESLYRITNKYLILLEPSYELASKVAKDRMEKHGYVSGLYQTAINLGYNVIKYELFKPTFNDDNPTGIIIIKKDSIETPCNFLACPVTKTKLINYRGAYYSEESLLAYPIVDHIPCLLPENAIIASHFMK